MKEFRTTFEKCWKCPLHHREQGDFDGDWCYNERPYRQIKDSDAEPFPVWCKLQDYKEADHE